MQAHGVQSQKWSTVRGARTSPWFRRVFLAVRDRLCPRRQHLTTIWYMTLIKLVLLSISRTCETVVIINQIFLIHFIHLSFNFIFSRRYNASFYSLDNGPMLWFFYRVALKSSFRLTDFFLCLITCRKCVTYPAIVLPERFFFEL